jgi:hypothetical protein
MASAAELIDFGGVQFARIQNRSAPATGTNVVRSWPMAGLAMNTRFRGNDAASGTQRQRAGGMAAEALQRRCLRIKRAKAGVTGVRVARS